MVAIRQHRLDSRLLGDELEYGASHANFAAEPNRHLFESRALNVGAIGRALISQEHVPAFANSHEMLAGDRLIGENQIPGCRAAKANRFFAEENRFATIRALDD